MNELDRLPKMRSDTTLGKAENGFGLAVLGNGALFVVLLLLAKANVVSTSTVGSVFAATFAGIWLIPFVAVVTNIFLQGAAWRAFGARDFVRFLQLGTSSQSKRHAAWLAVARALEARGALADAAEALRRGLSARGS